MAVIKSKGTVLRKAIGGQMIATAQIIGLTQSGAASESFESDTLDNTSAGIPRAMTGRSAGGTTSGELFFDPVLAGHQEFTDLITTPALCDFDIIFADAATTTWGLSAAALGFDITVALADGLKASFSLEHNGIVSYAT